MGSSHTCSQGAQGLCAGPWRPCILSKELREALLLYCVQQHSAPPYPPSPASPYPEEAPQLTTSWHPFQSTPHAASTHSFLDNLPGWVLRGANTPLGASHSKGDRGGPEPPERSRSPCAQSPPGQANPRATHCSVGGKECFLLTATEFGLSMNSIVETTAGCDVGKQSRPTSQ